MSQQATGMVLAAREHLLSGNPITRLEALVLFGLPDLTRLITDVRRDGWIVKSKRVPYAAAVVRINRHATLQPPSNLPIREIFLTEYLVSK
jgi:hypothetical protein